MELNRAEHITGSCIATAVPWEIPQITMYPLNSLSLLIQDVFIAFNVTQATHCVDERCSIFFTELHDVQIATKKISLNPLILSYRNRLMVSICRWSWIYYNHLGFFASSVSSSFYDIFPPVVYQDSFCHHFLMCSYWISWFTDEMSSAQLRLGKNNVYKTIDQWIHVLLRELFKRGI